VTYLPAIQRAPRSAKRSSAARCWAGDDYQSLAVLNWLDWFMAVGVGKLRPSLDPTRSAAQVLFGSKALRRRVRALRVLWRDLTEESVVTPTVFTGQYFPSQKPVR
jgi:hypothetical protein